jgi:hypothetical protein
LPCLFPRVAPSAARGFSLSGSSALLPLDLIRMGVVGLRMPMLSSVECRFRGLVGCHFWPSRPGTSRFCVIRPNKFEFTLQRIRVFGNWPSRTNPPLFLLQICVYLLSDEIKI